MTRLILHEDIHDAYVKQLSARMGSLAMGDVLDPKTQLGSLISAAHLQRVDRYVKEAVTEGARLVCGGERYAVPPCDKGSYYRPTILDNVKREAKCWREEIFGPVLVAAAYRDIRDAIRMANDTSFGLGANIFTRNYRTAFWAGKKINAGSVWVNIQNGSQIAGPFGGNRNSGMGREYGVFGLHEYLKVKNNVWNMGGGLA